MTLFVATGMFTVGMLSLVIILLLDDRRRLMREITRLQTTVEWRDWPDNSEGVR